MADSSTPLTALCNICHSAPPKYTCPRDKVRTCSLACSQSHKKRANCNGVRDPAAYIPKSALTTASGIDRDYNFLSGVERNIDKADRDVQERGVSLSGQGNMAFQKRWHDSGALARYLREHRIRVHKAPVGMARQKANQTRFIQKSKRIVWTVEWVVEGEKKIAEVDEKASLRDAYRELLAEKEKETKKRKRGNDSAGNGKKSKAAQPTTSEPKDAPPEEQKRLSEDISTTKNDKSEQTEADPLEKSKQTEADSLEKSAVDESVLADVPPLADPTAEPSTENESNLEQDEIQRDQTPQADFYLHKPHTSSRNTVLVPLLADATLTSALTGRSLLEFPTIYVFPRSEQHDLPDGFITDTQYVDEKTTEDKEVQELLSSLPEDQRNAALSAADPRAANAKSGESDWDDNKVLEVLKRDVDALQK